MAEPDLHPQRRSSSQASSASTKSQRARTLRAQAGTRRGRKGTLAKLTTGIPNNPGRAALFDDSVLPHDVPGALHLAEDTHIERLIASTGPVKIVRQFARDLAQRDAEISALRQRADARERELKRMLREVSVSNQDIERRLYQLENPIDDRNSDEESTHSGDQSSQHSAGLNGLMSQAMADAVGSQAEDEQPDLPSNFNATIRALRAEDGVKQAENAANRKRQGSLRGWGDYLFGTSAATSRKTSRASSIVSDMKEIEEDDGTEHPRVASNPPRRKALDEQLFQPPGQLSSNGAKQRLTSNSANGDDASVHSRKSSRSIGSWTIKLFAGGSQSKDSGDSEANSDYAAASDQNRNPSAAAPKTPMSAVASLKRIDSSTKVPSARGPSGMNPAGKKTPSSRRNPAGSVAQGNAAESTELSSTNLGPVEMDAILPVESRPPSLAPIYNKSLSQEYLTDRFGFIYDQRRKKRQREATPARPTKPPLNIAETLGNLRADASDIEDGNGEQNDESVKSPVSPPGSPIDPDSGSVGLPPIVSLTTASESRPHSGSVSVDKDGSSLSFQSSAQPSALTSTITADSPEFAGSSQEPSVQRTVAKSNTAETEPVKLLLEQLTDLHDNLQRDRAVRWNEFLRKVRAERRKEGEAAAAATSSDRTSLATVDTPEASLTDGEVVGIAGLGNKGKVGRAKWREFRALVLGGIPVALRAKVWSECSGASGMRIPGYYDDLVRGVGGDDPDPSVVAQIDMDIRRTLTDNVFFRKGPGVAKLKEVLLAYSRRNAEVGYCQGMNLIAASLLLIMPTAEDAFWILASMIEMILPQHYYDHGLLASRADQVVLRQYISEILPNLSAHLEELGIELEALTFQWFLSLFTDCLSAEALYRVWDVVLCLNVTSTIAPNGAGSNLKDASDKAVPASDDFASGSGGGSTFLFQVALALLKLNEPELLTTCSTPAALYTYINHQMTNHAISIDGLIQASEALRNVVRREDVVSRRAVALDEMRRMSGASP
ncbi:hypothetical protein N7470_003341 [Penicillium chermesinum]|nr:hypothetical protein N7470_003341 [Penicillium chermesinum]